MNAKERKQWAYSVIAKGFTDVIEDAIIRNVLSAADADSLSRSLAHRCDLWDMLPGYKPSPYSEKDPIEGGRPQAEAFIREVNEAIKRKHKENGNGKAR